MSASASALSIIVPTLNEEVNIATLVAQIMASAVRFREIVFVDEGSTDATRDMIYALAGRCSLQHDKNRHQAAKAGWAI